MLKKFGENMTEKDSYKKTQEEKYKMEEDRFTFKKKHSVIAVFIL